VTLFPSIENFDQQRQFLFSINMFLFWFLVFVCEDWFVKNPEWEFVVLLFEIVPFWLVNSLFHFQRNIMALNQINCSYFSILISFGLTRFQAKQFFLTSFNILVQQKLLHRCRYNFQPMLSLLCSMQKCIMRPTYNLLQKNIKTRQNKKIVRFWKNR